MKREDFDAPHLVSIGLTTEHFELLEELARKSYRWLEAYLLIDVARGANLSTARTHERTRISTIILELDKEMYLRAWGI